MSERFTDVVMMNCLSEAYSYALRSPDTSNQNGAVIVDRSGMIVSRGCNTFPDGFSPNGAYSQEEKYRLIEHAERMAIYKSPSREQNYVMACPWAACCDCARGIVLSGIKYLVIHTERMNLTPERWKGNVDEALTRINKAGIIVVEISGSIKAEPVFVNGEVWSPEELCYI